MRLSHRFSGLALAALILIISPATLSVEEGVEAVGEAPPIPPLTVSTVNGVDIAWTEMGDPGGPPMLMVMGMGASHKVWGRDFPAGLVEQGFRLIIFDNRDVGQSQRFDDWGQPTLWWNLLKDKLGLEVSHAYTLSDMANDGVALLHMLGIERAHVLGVSMGGMIAQTIAIEHPERVISLVSIMSSSGAPHLPEASRESTNAIREVADAPAEEVDDIHARGMYPEAIPRQLMAILHSGDRSEKLKELRVPTLVLHGEDDTLIPLAHGKHTAQVIPDARFFSFPGMAHNIPPDVRPRVLEKIELYALPLSEPRQRQASAARETVAAP